jgi:hypothetical protein
MMNRAIVVTLLLTSATALAGKEERDFMNSEVQPKAKEAASKWKSSCGCELRIQIDDASFTKKEDMYAAASFFGHIIDGVGGYCTDGASKKAVCQLKTLVVKKADDATFVLKGSIGTATVYGNTSPSFEMMTEQLDK